MKKYSIVLLSALVLSNSMFGMAGAQNTASNSTGWFSGLTNMFQSARSSFNGAVNKVKQNVAAKKAEANQSNPMEFAKEVKAAAKDVSDFATGAFETTEACANYIADYPTYNVWIRVLNESHAQIEDIKDKAIDNGTLGSVESNEIVDELKGIDTHVAKKQAQGAGQTTYTYQGTGRNRRRVARTVRKVESQDATVALKNELIDFNTAVAKYIHSNKDANSKNSLINATNKAKSFIITMKNELEAKKQRAVNTDPAANLVYGSPKLRTWLVSGVVILGAMYFMDFFNKDTGIFAQAQSVHSSFKDWAATQLNDVVDRAVQQRANGSTAMGYAASILGYFGFYGNNPAPSQSTTNS